MNLVNKLLEMVVGVVNAVMTIITVVQLLVLAPMIPLGMVGFQIGLAIAIYISPAASSVAPGSNMELVWQLIMIGLTMGCAVAVVVLGIWLVFTRGLVWTPIVLVFSWFALGYYHGEYVNGNISFFPIMDSTGTYIIHFIQGIYLAFWFLMVVRHFMIKYEYVYYQSKWVRAKIEKGRYRVL